MAFDGTPGPGRPKGSRNGAAVAKEWAEKKGGWELIIRMVEGKEPNFTRSAQVRAQLAMFLIDRAYGKASQSLELSGPGGSPIDVRSLLLDLCANPQQVIEDHNKAAQIQVENNLQLKALPPPVDGDAK